MHEIILGRSPSDAKKLGTKGAVFIGKQYVQMGQSSSLSNSIYMDVSRAHAMLIVGKRGGGKCVHPNTEILLSNGEKITILKLFESFKKNDNKIERNDNIEEYICNEEILIKSFNEKLKKFEDKKITNVYRRKVNESLVKWNTLNGSLLTTKDHKILIEKDFGEISNTFELEWVSYNDLKEKKDDCKFYKKFINFNKNCKNYSSEGYIWNEISFNELDKLEIEYEGYVYDISVEDNHNFIANNVVIHNSYTMGSIAEGLADMDPNVSKNLSFLMLDTMGVYWSMKYGNKKEDDLLRKWGLEGKGLDVVVCVPGGFFQKYQEDGIQCDYPLYIKPSELSLEDWRLTFKLKVDDPAYLLLAKVVGKMLDREEDFELQDIVDKLKQEDELSKEIVLSTVTRVEQAMTWGIFSKNARPIRELLFRGKVTVLDFSAYVSMPGGWEVKALALGLIAKKIFVERMLVRKREELHQITSKTQISDGTEIEDDLPMPWLIIDEAHEFLPESGETPATNALMTILREGRQPGVSLILATQQPAKIHTDAITQSDIVLAHRLTASFDLQSLDKIFLSYNSKGSKALFNQMPKTKGCAIIMDDKNERLYTMQVKPRISWHGGEDPSAIEEIEEEFDF